MQSIKFRSSGNFSFSRSIPLIEKNAGYEIAISIEILCLLNLLQNQLCIQVHPEIACTSRKFKRNVFLRLKDNQQLLKVRCQIYFQWSLYSSVPRESEGPNHLPKIVSKYNNQIPGISGFYAAIAVPLPIYFIAIYRW